MTTSLPQGPESESFATGLWPVKSSPVLRSIRLFGNPIGIPTQKQPKMTDNYCWWFRNLTFTSWGGRVIPIFISYIPGGDRRISESSTVWQGPKKNVDAFFLQNNQRKKCLNREFVTPQDCWIVAEEFMESGFRVHVFLTQFCMIEPAGKHYQLLYCRSCN